MNALVKEPAILWTDVGAVTDVPRRGARRVPSPRGDIAIFRTGDGAVFALMDRCPHKGGPLSQGIVHGQSVTCPLHGRVIDLATGEGTGADKGHGCAPVVPLEVVDGRLMLGVVGG
ncbi:MAG: nitrite reductase (NAD(P)H) small subunit [Phenylobacterium sp.]|uniref:nitrite reductase (NAD(P)H) small subunit n=1 Tax=Phenylobacterium sp. TaxID=1871053 RepID=UPI0027269BB0|nr:nitrite reductase (NAD(P)H) small subunit [Phenylobacterium sp.]MDO8911451.1 nitrite reductase (NAD(P)H) small subunit [Phenylobacterium sp.]MDO9245004.1 nitrite reductase (NAD(P)H) small subunit [Phenylobacterium sp.]MDP2011509.1 nitrite reductase (NAD(P)H) small subunit [Phenylobacterium sp.]MDP3098911.1 nitrite reductase (NAD(P)H) small subunit [Phenylobacterium sp.]MDP3632235.1 nitrite reductase (NAD(P)H) small subunit [Phenylobacterium sp.]